MATLPPDAFSAKLRQIADSVRGMARNASVGLIDGMEKIAESAVKRLTEKTPRSDDPGTHIADGWVARRIDMPGFLAIEVVNIDPRANAPITLKGGGETTLLEILEYGSEEHDIFPRDPNGHLVFTVDGMKIVTKHVKHPGTRAYSMVAVTQAEVSVDVKKLIDATRRVLTLRRTGRIR